MTFGHELVLGLISVLSVLTTVLLGVLAWNWKNFTQNTENYKKKMFELFDSHCKDDIQNFKEVTALAHSLNSNTLNKVDASKDAILSEIRGLRKER